MSLSMSHGPVSQNKYYVYSAFGRTGSTRLCNLLSPTPHCLWAPFHRDNLSTETVIHSHCLLPIPEGFRPILSTRKDKRDIVLSNLIARKTDDWVPGWKNPQSIKPFTVDKETYIALSKQLILKEQQFTKKHSPTIIYLEDSVETICEKLELKIPDKYDDTKTKSRYKPSEFIENYEELLHLFPLW